MYYSSRSPYALLSLSVFVLAVFAIVSSSVLLTKNAWAQSACVDTDGDGWGWDGSSSCQVEAGTGTAVDDCIDSDGDGWGWGSGGSCRVDSANAVDNGGSNNNSNSGTNSNSGECIDTDGDGWGWNGQSCQVSASQAPAPQVPAPAPQNPVTPGGSNVQISGSFDRNQDLVALHFDHAPDRDDGHAAVAGYIVATELGLNVSVVGGAHGLWNRGRYDSASEGLMTSIWGGQWLDAHNNRASAISVATSRWASTLTAGGDVWVAEGGQADFTAAVVRAIRQQFPEIQTSARIHVVQHSQWNEDHATAGDLSFVKSNTHYIRIADGNDPNSTADFRSETPQSFINAAQSSRYAGIWNAAFAYLSPYEKLDFSDTVELMHILGIGPQAIGTVDQFADRFVR